MMTAAAHLAYAQQLLGADALTSGGQAARPDPATVGLAQAHALCAVAIELGVPVTPEVTEPQATP